MAAARAIAVAASLTLGAAAAWRARRNGRAPAAGLRVLRGTHDETVIDAGGAVRSVQSASVALPVARLDALWTARDLERLARTYWGFLGRATLGIVRVRYGPGERRVCLLVPQLALLVLSAPQYELDERRGLVRWRIVRGALVDRSAHDGDGHLQIAVRREPAAADTAHVHVAVEVANFHPAIATAIGRWIYAQTQSRVHVLVTRAYLRSLAALELEDSVVGRFAADAGVAPAPRQP